MSGESGHYELPRLVWNMPDVWERVATISHDFFKLAPYDFTLRARTAREIEYILPDQTRSVYAPVFSHP